MKMDKMYVVVCTDDENQISIWEEGFKTYEDAQAEVLKMLKNEFDCPVLESYDADEIEKNEYLEFIVEDELAHYDGYTADWRYTIHMVCAPK